MLSSSTLKLRLRRSLTLLSVCSLVLSMWSGASASATAGAGGAALPSAGAECVELPGGLSSWWTGDDSGEDFQGNQDGVLWGGVTYDEGVIGRGFVFDGADDHVKLPDNFFPHPLAEGAALNFFAYTGPTLAPDNGSPLDEPYTISLWFKTTADGVIFGQQGYYNSVPVGHIPFIYVGTDGHLYVPSYRHQHTSTAPSPTPVNDGEFHHVAVTYAPDDEDADEYGTQVIYLDGAEMARMNNIPYPYATRYEYTFGTGLTSGNWPEGDDDGWHPFAGVIDDAQLYDRALKEEEVLALRQAAQGGYCSYTVSGRLADSCRRGFAGQEVTLTRTDATRSVPVPTRVAVTDADGFYRFERVARGGDYTVTPPRGAINFTPSSRTFLDLSTSQSADFFDPTQYLWCPPQP